MKNEWARIGSKNFATLSLRNGLSIPEALWWAASELPAAYSHACACSNGIFPGRTPWPLRESRSRENHPRRRDDHFPECFLKPKDFSPIGSHFPAISLLTPSLVDQVRRVLAEAVGPPRGTARDEAKPYPCFKYAEPELQAVGFFLRIRRVNPWLFQRQPSFLGKAGENSPRLLGSNRERESQKNSSRAGSQSFWMAPVRRSAAIVLAATALKKMQNAKGSNLEQSHLLTSTSLLRSKHVESLHSADKRRR